MRRYWTAAGAVIPAFLGVLQAASFEVASVKPNKSGDSGTRFQAMPGGRVVVTNATPRQLIRQAYRILDNQLTGGPNWIDSLHFDIEAKAPEGTRESELPAMLQGLLADRFKLTVHHETREATGFALVMARADGKLGAKLVRSDLDCDAMAAAAMAAGANARGGAPPPLAPGARPPCSTSSGLGRIVARNVPMSRIATLLGQLTQRVVVDRTGLAGGYDLDLTYTPDQIPPGPLPPGVEPPDPDGPSLYTALQEQLGLKLESQKTSVDVLVIDRIELPSEN